MEEQRESYPEPRAQKKYWSRQQAYRPQLWAFWRNRHYSTADKQHDDIGNRGYRCSNDYERIKWIHWFDYPRTYFTKLIDS